MSRSAALALVGLAGLIGLAGCPGGDSNPAELWLNTFPNDETRVRLVDTQPAPF